MSTNARKTRVIIGAAAAAALVGGGVAVAAANQFGGKEESAAIIDAAAKQLGVQPSKLSDALEQAYEQRIDAAVAAGRLTKEQGDELKARLKENGVPLMGPMGPGFRGGGFGRPGFDHFGGDAAATYLGLSESELRTQLESGKSLAQIAKDENTSVDGLEKAMVTAAEKELDAAVAAGNVTDAQRDAIVTDLPQRIDDMVNRTPPAGGDRYHDHDGGLGGPPPGGSTF